MSSNVQNPLGQDDPPKDGPPKKEEAPKKEQAKFPLASLFSQIKQKEAVFRILRQWLNSPKDAKGVELLTKAKPPGLHDSVQIVKESSARMEGTKKQFELLQKSNPDLDLQGLNNFLNGSHDTSARKGQVYMPYKMYGEYGPSVSALLCGTAVAVTHPGPGQAADAQKVADVLRWFGGKNVSVAQVAPENYGKFSDLHFDWKKKDIPGRFRLRLGELASDEKLALFTALYEEAERREVATRASSKKKPQRKQASLSPSSVSVAPGLVFRFCVWIRNATNNPSKNMTPELYQTVLEELAVTLDVYADIVKLVPPPNVCLILLGDIGAPNVTTAKATRDTLLGLLGVRFPDYAGDVSVVDLRGFVELTGKGPFCDFYTENPVPDFDPPVQGVANYLNYLDQWLIYYYLGSIKLPKFIIGTEAGNMDAIGYAGTPVISIDKTDPVADLPFSVMTDRIGQYTLLTPLWQVVNFNGPDAGFREYLRGAMLRFMFFTRSGNSDPGEIYKAMKDFDSDEYVALPPELDAQFERVEVEGDGNCLFRALAVGAGDGEAAHAAHRTAAATYARDNFTLVTLNAGTGGNYADNNAYFAVMSVPAAGAEENAKWGGYVETEAWARAKDTTVKVHSSRCAMVAFNEGRAKTVNLFYVNGNHYEFLKPKLH